MCYFQGEKKDEIKNNFLGAQGKRPSATGAHKQLQMRGKGSSVCFVGQSKGQIYHKYSE